MNELNEIQTVKIDNCIIHICDNSTAKTKEEQEKIMQEFSNLAYKLCTNKE